MSVKGLFALAFVATSLAPTTTHSSPNFVVLAATPEVAEKIAAAAELQRKELGKLWFGKELPPWQEPLAIHVEVTLEQPSGSSNFVFGPKGGIKSHYTKLRGPLDKILTNVLPHEMTHVILMHHFGGAFPRWADEGGAVLAEDAIQRRKHDKVMVEQLYGGKAWRLRVLFGMGDYPKTTDLLSLFYAQGQSVSRFLVETKGRSVFLAFIAQGTRESWDAAALAQYGDRNVEELEARWVRWVQAQKAADTE